MPSKGQFNLDSFSISGKLFLIAGLYAIESKAQALKIAQAISVASRQR